MFIFKKNIPIRSKNLPHSHLVEWGLVDRSKNPVDDLEEWDDTESKTEAKEPSKGGHEVHRTHSDASLKLYKDYRWQIIFKIHITHDSVLAKEDVNDSNILFPSIVELILEIKVENIYSTLPLTQWQADRPCASSSLGLPMLRCRRELSGSRFCKSLSPWMGIESHQL